MQSDLRPFEDLVAGIERAHDEAQHHEPSADELEELAVDRFVVNLTNGDPIGGETSAGTGFWPVISSPVDEVDSLPLLKFDRQLGLREMTSAEADATMKSLRWHNAVFPLMRGLRARIAPSLRQAIQDLAILVSPPMDRRVVDGSGAIRHYSDIVRGPLRADGPTSTIAIGRVNGPTIYDLLSSARSDGLGHDAVSDLKFALTLDLALLTATDQALFAHFASLEVPPVDEIHRSYLDKSLSSFQSIASASGLELDGRSARLIGQSFAKLVKSIEFRGEPLESANVGLRSDPSPRNWVFDSGGADVGLADFVATHPDLASRSRFRRFRDHVRRIDVPTTIGYGLYFEDSAHLTEFHWAAFTTDQKVRIRFVGDLVREMLLVVFSRPHDYDSIDYAEQLALDIEQVVNRNHASWSASVWERYAQWAHLNARNYEIGGFLRMLRQVELNLGYRDNVIQKVQRSDPASEADTDLQELIELEIVGYLRRCADETHQLGNSCGLSLDEVNALSGALRRTAVSLSQRYRSAGSGLGNVSAM